MKQCSRCRREKNETEFYRYNNGKLRSECKECDHIDSKLYREVHQKQTKIRSRKYYKNNKNILLAKTRQTYLKYKEQWKGILLGLCAQFNYYCCVDCTNPQFEFHHLNPATKEFAISQFIGMKRKPTEERMHKVIEELKKCIPLCRPCHQRRHDNMRSRNLNGTFI
jgi:hypothetical protein